MRRKYNPFYRLLSADKWLFTDAIMYAVEWNPEFESGQIGSINFEIKMYNGKITSALIENFIIHLEKALERTYVSQYYDYLAVQRYYDIAKSWWDVPEEIPQYIAPIKFIKGCIDRELILPPIMISWYLENKSEPKTNLQLWGFPKRVYEMRQEGKSDREIAKELREKWKLPYSAVTALLTTDEKVIADWAQPAEKLLKGEREKL